VHHIVFLYSTFTTYDSPLAVVMPPTNTNTNPGPNLNPNLTVL